MFLCSIFGQETGMWMHPNKGQWAEPILYKVELDYGEMFIEKNQFTYALNDFKQKMSHQHENKSKSAVESSKIIESHIIKSTFKNSSWAGVKNEKSISSFYRNYFQGNDPLKWRSKLNSFKLIEFVDFYPNIDLVLDGNNEKFKYSFIVYPNTNPAQIQYEITGANSVKIDEKGNLIIENRFGNIIEEKPIAWTYSKTGKKDVEVNFRLNENKVSFQFPEGFNQEDTLIIDPSLLFSTFSGSTADNWGMTATPDTQGNLLAGGIVFNDGGVYPVTVGAFNTTINGGDSYVLGSLIQGFDIAISKFNPKGTQLLYATYLGGTANEAPHSLVTNGNDDLFIMGVTASTNFPTSSSAFDNSFNGGPEILENELFYRGTDIFVTKLSQDGSQLLGSTYIGGSGTDGVNIGDLNYNYGDPFRGEIIEGADGYVYVSSTTQSSDFPTVNASQSSLKGSQDAVVFKLNSDLSSIGWSSYFGGSGLETGNSIQKSSNGSLYVAGGTTSTDLPFLIGNDLSYNGGIADGYVMRLANSSGNILQGTYMGLNEYDQAYFVQLDLNNDVYVYGQTESSWPITAGKYGNPNSGQFIRRYNQSLTSIVWTTMVGAGTGYPEISPTAFLVSNCSDIYISGWGGQVNNQNSQYAHNSNTSGFPITGDAFQSLTNGDNFYIAVLGNDASTLKYATFMGGVNGSYNHVDGGTSRFDKSGRIYHAVCGGCGRNLNGFTTTPGVFSPQNQGSNCNLAAFKFELNSYAPIIGSADSVICLPDSVIFKNSVSNGNSFLWDFGDGTISKSLNPKHYYSIPGKYIIKLLVKDTVNCFVSDSFYFDVRVVQFLPSVVIPLNPVCAGNSFTLNASGGLNYSWTPTNVLSNPLIANPIAKIYSTTNFQVVISDVCGSQTLNVNVVVLPVITSLTNDTTICLGQSVQLKATGGVSYQWSPSTFELSSLNSVSPICTPSQTRKYYVNITSLNGCITKDSVIVSVHQSALKPIVVDSIICIQDSLKLVNSNASSVKFDWSFGDGITSKLFLPTHYYTNPGTYPLKVVFTDTVYCFVKDSILKNIKVNQYNGGILTPPQSICPNTSFQLEAFGGTNYLWSPANLLDNSTIAKPIATINSATTFTVLISDECGSGNYTLPLSVYSNPHQISSDTSICIGGNAQLFAIGGSSYSWTPTNSLNNPLLSNPVATPLVTTKYFVNIITGNNCSIHDSTVVKVFNFPPIPILKDSVKTCRYSSVQLIADGAERYKWSPNQYINSNINDTVIVNPLNSITYYCDFINACGKSEDSIYIEVLIPQILPAKDTSICPNNSAKLYANGGIKYDWYFNTGFIGTTMLDSFVVFPTVTSNYSVVGTDKNNCKDTASMNVILYVPVEIRACPTIYAIQGDIVELSTINSPVGIYTWSPNTYLSCDVCLKPFANPDMDFTYKVTLIDSNGCISSDKVQIKYDGLIFVPNTFTPDAPINNIFIPKGGNIRTFEISIFDRWGSIVFTSNSIDQGWDGTFKGVKCQVGTYTWKILYGDYNHTKKELVGHINLLR